MPPPAYNPADPLLAIAAQLTIAAASKAPRGPEISTEAAANVTLVIFQEIYAGLLRLSAGPTPQSP